jgi:CheY-like chemotaxis protein
VHEAGLAFDAPVDVRRFVKGGQEEAEEPASDDRYGGHLLCVEGCPEERALLNFQIAELGPTVSEADDAPEALELAQSGAFHLVLLGESLASMPPHELAETLRCDGYQGPLIQWSESATQPKWSDARFPKPFRPEDVRDLVATHLPKLEKKQSRIEQPLESEFWANQKLRPLLLNYLETLEEQAIRLQQMVQNANLADTISLVRQIRKSAGSYGYPSISAAADEVLQNETDRARVFEAADRVTHLCNRACAFLYHVDYQQIESAA